MKIRIRNKAYQRYIQAIDATINDEIKMIEKELPKLEDDLRETSLSIISNWYAQYEPYVYHRQMSLKNAFNITVNPDRISVDYSPKYLDDYYHHQESDIIFNNSFIGGYHGGSGGDNNPIPRWREPTPFYFAWSSCEVPQSFSPYERIEKETQKILDVFADKVRTRRQKHIQTIKKYNNMRKGVR